MENKAYMEKFAFGILTYNQEKYILETLESIKYQKIFYGKNWEVNLIITDDASKDATVEVIKEWIQKNEKYFSNIELIANEKNKGTVANYCTILEKVGNRKFKILAGDDLIGKNNLFKEYQDLTDKKLKTYFRIELCDGKIYYREKYLIDFYYHKYHNWRPGYNLKYFRRGRYLHTPSTLYTTNLFEMADCKKNLRDFRIYEDEPTWYSMIRNVDDLEIDFVESGIVLYRIHNQSISNVPNPVFRSESRKMKEWYYNDARGLEKLYFAIKKYTNVPRYLNICLYIEKMHNLKRKWVCEKDPRYKEFKEKIEQQVKEEQKFYDSIMEKISNHAI